jgi:hypothetical protein
MQSKQLVWCLILMLLNTRAIGGLSPRQNPSKDHESEQTVFEAEPDTDDKMHINKPAEIPESALQALQDTLGPGQIYCLRSRGVAPEQVPASWFLASAIHLNGPDEVDFIVLLNSPSLGDPKNPGGCLLPANGSPFWVLGPGLASRRYGLLLGTYGLSLEVLNSRTNGYKDIQTEYASPAIKLSTTLYKYMVHQYQVAEKKIER